MYVFVPASVIVNLQQKENILLYEKELYILVINVRFITKNHNLTQFVWQESIGLRVRYEWDMGGMGATEGRAHLAFKGLLY